MSYSRTYLQSRTPREISDMANLSRSPVETGHKQFDNAVNGDHGYLGTGNVFSANQRSGFIRAHTKTTCNGRTNAPGHLQDYDLEPFKLPAMVERAVREEAHDKDVILYEIQSSKSRNTTVHGYLVTDTFHRELRSFTAQTPKCDQIMNAVRSHLSWDDHDMVDPVPAAEIEELTADFAAEDFHALAAHLGYGSADDAQSCKESGLYFSDEAPYSSWKDMDPPYTMSRADTPGLAAALLAIRAGIDLKDLQVWIEERRAEKEFDTMEP
jgi:hypothetical protein